MSSVGASPSSREESERSRHRVSSAGLVLREVGRERLAVALLLDAFDERVERHAALLISRPAAPYRDGAGGGLLVPDDEHVARLPLLRLLDAVAQIAGLFVEVHPKVSRAQLLRGVARVVER